MTKKGFTLIEAVMVMTIISVLAASGAWLMAYVVRDSVFLPSQLNTDMIGSDALNIMLEGDSIAKGLRFSRSLTDIQNNQLTFVNQDNQTLIYRLDAAASKLYRSINGSNETLCPYYLASAINVTGSGGQVFTYYDSNEAVTASPAGVKRVNVSLVVKSGSGSFSDWQGQSNQSSSIKVSSF